MSVTHVTVQAAAEMHSVSEATVRRWIASKKLRAYRPVPGGRVLIKLSDLEKMLEASLDEKEAK